MKLLPFEPESPDAIRQRWGAILKVIYDQKQLEAETQVNPAFQRRHVFDFPDGIRLVASLERAGAPQAELHLSFGIHNSFHSVWIPKGREAYLARCRELVAMLQSYGLVGTDCSQTFLTQRAFHFWFHVKSHHPASPDHPTSNIQQPTSNNQHP
jgi:hypothetical protein